MEWGFDNNPVVQATKGVHWATEAARYTQFLLGSTGKTPDEALVLKQILPGVVKVSGQSTPIATLDQLPGTHDSSRPG
jgi:hypothetical protein